MSSQMETRLKKRYGQHFLRDTGMIARIVGFIGPRPDDLLVEIGAGDGALSIRLAPKVLRLVALEIDREVIPALERGLAPYGNAEVIGGDILKINLPDLLTPRLGPGITLRIAGNLPYNIGTAIIEILLALALPIKDMAFMLQLETARRIVAAPGSGEYGYFSVLCQHHCAVNLGFQVPPACFVPRPRVTSAMVSLKPKDSPGDREFEEAFKSLAKAAFAYRRKKIVNSLGRCPQIGPAVGELLGKAGIDGARRAEDLTVAEYERLAHIYRATGKSGGG